jgi:hypothetical protein
MSRQIWCCCLLVVCLFAYACTPPSPHQEQTYPVSGTVTLDGAPLADGEINFITRETAALDVLPIKNGKFEGQAKAGKRRVEIKAFREEEVVPMPGADPQRTRVNYIPPQYNANSKLTAEVTPDGANQFTFEVFSDESGGGAAPESGDQ